MRVFDRIEDTSTGRYGKASNFISYNLIAIMLERLDVAQRLIYFVFAGDFIARI